MEKMKDIAEGVIRADQKQVVKLVTEALDEGLGVEKILQNGLLAGMKVVGDRFKKDEIYIPEVIVSAKTMHKALEILKPALVVNKVKNSGLVVMGTVRGDLHDIGKNLVIMMLEGAGFEVIDLGVDVADEVFVQTVKENKPNILGISALLTTTMPTVKEVIRALEEAGVRDGLKVMVGGAPVTSTFAIEAGADGYAENAGSAVDEAKMLIEAVSL